MPVDLSPRSLIGLDYAAMLATATEAELVVFCNINLPEQARLEDFAESENLELDEAGLIELERLTRERAPHVAATVLVAFGESPPSTILDVADREAVDMIIIASHGRTGMTRWLLGSVAERVARGAEVPVLVVPVRLDPSPDPIEDKNQGETGSEQGNEGDREGEGA